jgi:folate-binding protein YgfZ
MTLLFDETAVFYRPEGVVRVSGPDRLAYLHLMLSQHLEGADVGTVADFLYLDPKGNARAAGRAIVHPEHVFLATPAEVVSELTTALEQFKFLMQVEAVDCSGQWTLASVRGPEQPTGAPAEAMRGAAQGEGLLIRDRAGGVDVFGPRDWVQMRVAGLPEASPQEWEAYRISSGVPGWGTEITPGRRAQELGLLPTHVHLKKGCYPGQESIAKIYNLGRARRALAVIEAPGPISVGDPVTAGEKLGEVTSAAQVGPVWVALALLPLERDGEIVGGGALHIRGVPALLRHRIGEGLPQPGA